MNVVNEKKKQNKGGGCKQKKDMIPIIIILPSQAMTNHPTIFLDILCFANLNRILDIYINFKKKKKRKKSCLRCYLFYKEEKNLTNNKSKQGKILYIQQYFWMWLMWSKGKMGSTKKSWYQSSYHTCDVSSVTCDRNKEIQNFKRQAIWNIIDLTIFNRSIHN